MTTNPFDRNKVKEARLGELITEPGEQNQRDAIHIAVVPIKAVTDLLPGQHVGVSADGKSSVTGSGLPVGIVDPFLLTGPREGDTFWLFLYQGQVTTLRHEWTHPAFPNVHEAPAVTAPSTKEVSEAWLRDWCSKNDCPRYETVLAAVLDGDYRSSWDRDYFHFDDQDAHASIPPEFWDHMAVVTGQTFDEPPISFSCSC